MLGNPSSDRDRESSLSESENMPSLNRVLKKNFKSQRGEVNESFKSSNIATSLREGVFKIEKQFNKKNPQGEVRSKEEMMFEVHMKTLSQIGKTLDTYSDITGAIEKSVYEYVDYIKLNTAKKYQSKVQITTDALSIMKESKKSAENKVQNLESDIKGLKQEMKLQEEKLIKEELQNSNFDTMNDYITEVVQYLEKIQDELPEKEIISPLKRSSDSRKMSFDNSGNSLELSQSGAPRLSP